MRRALLVVGLAGTLAGCGSEAIPGPALDPKDAANALVTDRAAYDVQVTAEAYRVDIELTFVNRLDERAFIPGCGGPFPPVLEKWTGSDWAVAFAPVVQLCLGPPVVIEPGASYRYRFELHAFRAPDMTPSWEGGAIMGRYRLVWDIARGLNVDGPPHPPGELLPIAYRVSNSFVLMP